MTSVDTRANGNAEPEYASPRIIDSRRIFGPNLFSALPGAALEVQCDDSASRAAVALWEVEARGIAMHLGWIDTTCAVRRASVTASLFLTAPLDGLMSATEVAEQAWAASELRVTRRDANAPDGEHAGTHDELADARRNVALRTMYANECATMTGIVRAVHAAQRAHRNVTVNDESVFVGGGAGATLAASTTRVPTPAAVLEHAPDCPIVLVTGSNGKTTTTRLLAAMWRTSGRCTGWSCSDGVWIDDEQVERGDYSGPSGAHRVVTDARVQAAVLESARGGMLRRGLAVSAVECAVITNIAADHFGEYGVESLGDLADVKAIVTRALKPGAPVVLNADDETLVVLSQRVACPVAWFSVHDSMLVHRAAAHGVAAATIRDGVMMLCDGHAWHAIASVVDMPITFGGNAHHNIANALAAALAAQVVGIPRADIQQSLLTFGASSVDNAGRLFIRTVGNVTVVMDYAHNPDGLASLCRTASSMLANRRLLLLGQAGDRDDSQLRALASTAWQALAFNRIVIKEMESLRRGRAAGAVTAVLHAALLAAGAPADTIECAPTELEGVRRALAWAHAGDLLVLGIHAERDAVYALVNQLEQSGWQAGAPLPPPV